MGLIWILVAYFLYFEVALVFLMCLEFISAARWKMFFNSSFISRVKTHGLTVFYCCLSALCLLFGDSLMKMLKYKALHEERKATGMPVTGGVMQMDPGAQLFLSQRNVYITGFALFLLLVVRRLAGLLSMLAHAKACEEAAVSQARNAASHSERLLEENQELRSGSAARDSKDKTDGASANQQLKEKTKELEAVQANLEAMKSQAESTNREYDRLLAEHTKLQDRISTGDKKSD